MSSNRYTPGCGGTICSYEMPSRKTTFKFTVNSKDVLRSASGNMPSESFSEGGRTPQIGETTCVSSVCQWTDEGDTMRAAAHAGR